MLLCSKRLDPITVRSQLTDSPIWMSVFWSSIYQRCHRTVVLEHHCRLIDTIRGFLPPRFFAPATLLFNLPMSPPPPPRFPWQTGGEFWYKNQIFLDLQTAKLEKTKTPYFWPIQVWKNKQHPYTHRAFLRIMKKTMPSWVIPPKRHTKFNFHSKIDGDLSKRSYFYSIVPRFFAKYVWWTKSYTSWYSRYPIIYRVLHIPGGAGFLPSTVSLRTWFHERIWPKPASAELFKDPKKAHNPKAYLGLSSCERWAPTNYKWSCNPYK